MGLNRQNNREGQGVSMEAFPATSSTGVKTEFSLDRPLKDWSLQVVGASTDIIVTLDLSAQSSSGATFHSRLTFGSSDGDADGDIVSLTNVPANQVRTTFEAGATSGGASAWIVGV